jgi:hypothetical protein
MKNHSKLLAAALFLLSGAQAVAEMYHREATATDEYGTPLAAQPLEFSAFTQTSAQLPQPGDYENHAIVGQVSGEADASEVASLVQTTIEPVEELVRCKVQGLVDSQCSAAGTCCSASTGCACWKFCGCPAGTSCNDGTNSCQTLPTCGSGQRCLDVFSYNIQYLTTIAACRQCGLGHCSCDAGARTPQLANHPELRGHDVIVLVEAFRDSTARGLAICSERNIHTRPRCSTVSIGSMSSSHPRGACFKQTGASSS